MEVQPDFRDLLALLNAHQVEFVIAGSHARSERASRVCPPGRMT